MTEELDIIKATFSSVVNLPANTDIGDYILVPFSDPVVAEPIVTLSFKEFITELNRITLNGGRDCPEVALSGIERALVISKPRSNIFLFTDAFPKDINKLASIENLCRNSLSQVIIFLTGYCKNGSRGNVEAYYDVAKACSGTVFQLNSADLRQVFRYIKEIIKVEWTNVISYDTFQNYKEISFSVDSFTKDVILAISGKYLLVKLSPVDKSNVTLENILESSHAQVIRLAEALPGDYTVSVRSQGTTSLTLYKKFQLPMQIGFSTKKPRSQKETSRRPMPGRENYILLDVVNTIKLELIVIQTYNDQENKTLSLQEYSADKYLAKTFIDPDKSFRIWIHGHDKVTQQQFTGSTKKLIPQMTVLDPTWIEPKAEILEGTSIIINYGNQATLACKVVGYPTPTVWWEDNEDNSTQSDSVLLEIPSLYISYYNIENVTTNITVFCKCRNSKGEDSQRIDVIVHRPFTFEVLQTPEDTTVEYGKEGRLFCQVSAYPEAEIKWYHNHTIVTKEEDLEVLSDENALLIKNMNVDKTGDYECEVSNTMHTKTYNAAVTISGMEAPQVEVDNSNITLHPGDFIDLECRVIRGKPTPVIVWKFISKDDFEVMLPEGVTLDKEKLKITAAQSEHNGVYRCYATNSEGRHFADIAVTVQYPPIISDNGATELEVKEDDNVVLQCDVTGSPAPTVWWERSQNGVIVPLDHRHHTDNNNEHRFKALDTDSGKYHCVAENFLGKVNKTIVVKVLVKPYIEAPASTTRTVRAGQSINLACNIKFGNPEPSTKWQFIALDSSSSVLQRGTSSLPLRINNVRHSNEGLYKCIADNIVGTDSISINVTVI
ncbi:unnamed protein product [Arctia plantaginis]|uniref:Ig-like domain-containing protein n=1 Tax=Arctia plantaginis TaxID=874455 RepID=A0A8S0ZFU5_ARCPL|nr:unnamed protein product [Arctia plantaginis]